MKRRVSIRLLSILFLIFPSISLSAQDIALSQYYANPLYLNPAMAGLNRCPTLNLSYRNQWPQFPGDLITYSASFDMYHKSISGGIGLLGYNDQQAGGLLNTLQVSGIYSYHLRLGQEMYLNAGFQASYSQISIKWDELVFSDQIDQVTGIISGNSSEVFPDNSNLSFPDFSTGVLYGYKNIIYAGAAIHHLTTPVISFYGEESGYLPRKVTLHAGATLKVSGEGYSTSDEKGLSISPNVLYQQQDQFRKINGGLYLSAFQIITGFWYRYNFDNPDAIIILAGFQHDLFKIGYSYDITISRMVNATGGAHELSFAWFFGCPQKSKKTRAIKCPEF